MRLGINLLDLDRIEPLVREILLRDKVDAESQPIITDKNQLDEWCVPFTCDLLTAACVCDTIRGKDRREKRYPTRVYLCKRKAWSKVSGSVMLSVVDGEEVHLNPAVFPTDAVEGEASEHAKRQAQLEHLRKKYGGDIRGCFSGTEGYLIEIRGQGEYPELGKPVQVMKGGARRFRFPSPSSQKVKRKSVSVGKEVPRHKL